MKNFTELTHDYYAFIPFGRICIFESIAFNKITLYWKTRVIGVASDDDGYYNPVIISDDGYIRFDEESEYTIEASEIEDRFYKTNTNLYICKNEFSVVEAESGIEDRGKYKKLINDKFKESFPVYCRDKLIIHDGYKEHMNFSYD